MTNFILSEIKPFIKAESTKTNLYYFSKIAVINNQ